MGVKEKVAVVTGGGQGIGRATTRALLENGYAVVIAEYDKEAGEETEREYRAIGPVRFVPTDIADESTVKGMVREVIAQFRKIDLVVNNAAISANRPVTSLSLRDWNRVIGVNLTGAFLCAKHTGMHLKKTYGSIINIASTRALMSEPDTEAYSASKGGIAALTHSLAISLGPKVRVNCISPGWIDVTDGKRKGRRRRVKPSAEDHAQHPCGRVGRPEDIASLIVYLASAEGSFITGANFVVDGGMTRKMIYI
jgi:NAD(P)-dependent dehydrogenase (short-subunit alcohol dehydrogenase family)